jgi:CBS domain-containing protein
MTPLSTLRLSDIASSSVYTVAPELPLGEAVALFAEHHVSSLIVVADQRPLGILTERDLVRLMCDGADRDAAIRQVMTSPVMTAAGDLDFAAAQLLMVDHGVRHLVLVDADGRLSGVATETDFRHHLGNDFFAAIKSLDAVMEQGGSLLAPDLPLQAALEHMRAGHLDHVVIGGDGIAEGILTERDIPRLLAGQVAATVPLRAVMSHGLQTIGVGFSVAEAARRLERSGLRHLIVVNGDGRMVGVLSQHRMFERLGAVLLDESRSRLADRLDVVLEATGVGTWEYDHRQGLITRSAGLNRLFHLPPDNVRETVADVLARIEPADRVRAAAAFDAVVDGRRDWFSVEYRERCGNGDLLWISARGRVVERGTDGAPLRTAGVVIDVSGRHREHALLEFSNAVLGRISTGAPLSEVLTHIVGEIEAQEAGTYASLLLLDETGRHLAGGIAPSLPAAYGAAIDGAAIGPRAGSCGTAAWRRAEVFVGDIASDPLWIDYKTLAAEHGLAACWSTPILSARGDVLGTFAIYWRTPRTAVGPEVRRYVVAATALAAVAIENTRREVHLQQTIDELRRWQQLTLGREGRLLELKQEVNALLARLGEAPRYASASGEGDDR